jgi:predicted aspartyl protease
MTSKLITALARVEGPRQTKLVHLVFDSGATDTILSPHAALAVGCPPDPSGKRAGIITASSLVYMPIVTIPAFYCLGLRVENFEIICHQLPDESTVGGVLGLDFLRRVPVFQEFEKKIFELTRF